MLTVFARGRPQSLDVQLALAVELREPLVDVLVPLRLVLVRAVLVGAVSVRALDNCDDNVEDDDDDALLMPPEMIAAAGAELGGRDSFAWTRHDKQFHPRQSY